MAQQKAVKMMRKVGLLAGSVLLLIASFGGSLAGALPYGAGAYNTCTYDTCIITVLTSGTVSLSVTPTLSGVNTTAKDDVSVSTDASTGYTLTFSDADTTTTLTSTGDNIPTSAGTQASPINLALNTWGYRVDGLSGFGAGPTSAQTSDSTAAYTFAGIPASNAAAHTLKTTAVAANPADVTNVWFGVRLDTTKPSATYTDVVTYTAVTNE